MEAGDGATKVCGAVRVGRKNPKNVWWYYVLKGAVEGKGSTE